MNITKSIKVAMAMTGLSKNDLGDRLSISQPVLNKLIREGKCTTDRLARLAEAFEMDVCEFISLGE